MGRQTKCIMVTAVLLVAMLFSMAFADEITGRITNQGKTPVMGAWIHVGRDLSLNIGSNGEDTLRGKALASVVTDKDGNYSLWLPGGNYIMVIWKPGFVPVTRTVKIPGTSDCILKAENNPKMHTNLLFEK